MKENKIMLKALCSRDLKRHFVQVYMYITSVYIYINLCLCEWICEFSVKEKDLTGFST